MRTVRIYDAFSMRLVTDVPCPAVVLAIEYIPDRNVLAVVLSDKTILFLDAGSPIYKTLRKLIVPNVQRCLCYVKRKEVLFSAGTNGAIFGWDLAKIFSAEFLEDELLREKEKRNFVYRNYITEKTPWFVGDTILCMVDLPNINFLASGAYDKKIKLWDLRNSAIEGGGSGGGEGGAGGVGGGTAYASESSARDKGQRKVKGGTSGTAVTSYENKKTKTSKKTEAKTEDPVEEYSKEPSKTLKGHEKAVREIAYSERHKILVSCGFDFEVFVWNPYYEKYILKLEGHESPLVGVNCPMNLPCFITCDTNGMVKVWNINDYSCIQTFYVSNVNQVTCIRTVPKHRRLICGCKFVDLSRNIFLFACSTYI